MKQYRPISLFSLAAVSIALLLLLSRQEQASFPRPPSALGKEENGVSLPEGFEGGYFDRQGEGLQIFQKMQSIYGSMDHFPDFYAGDYLDPVSGDLIILTCNAQQSELESLKLLLQTENITFRPVPYSMKELKAVRDQLMEEIEHLEQKDENGYTIRPVAMANIDVMANQVRVEVYGLQQHGVPPELQRILDQMDDRMLNIVPGFIAREL